MQRGYEFTYKAHQQMKGLIVLESEEPPYEKKLSFHIGEANVCLEKPGVWKLTPEPEFVKLD